MREVVVRRRRPAVLLSLLGLLAALVVVLPAPAAQAATSQPRYDTRLLVLVNQARVKAGLPTLSLFEPLTQQARSWSARMASNDSLTHDGSFGDKAKTVCSLSSGRENIAFTTGDADSMFRMYMNSPGHRAAILSADTQFLGLATVSVPWPDHPSIALYWNTMRFIGGTCMKSSTVTSSTPTTLTINPSASTVKAGSSLLLRVSLVAPAGPARSAVLWFVPSRTGVAERYTALRLGTTAKPTVYRTWLTVKQRESGSWKVTYAGATLSGGVGDEPSSRSVPVRFAA